MKSFNKVKTVIFVNLCALCFQGLIDFIQSPIDINLHMNGEIWPRVLQVIQGWEWTTDTVTDHNSSSYALASVQTEWLCRLDWASNVLLMYKAGYKAQTLLLTKFIAPDKVITEVMI